MPSVAGQVSQPCRQRRDVTRAAGTLHMHDPLAIHVKSELSRLGFSRTEAGRRAGVSIAVMDRICAGYGTGLGSAIKLDRLFGTTEARTCENLLRSRSSPYRERAHGPQSWEAGTGAARR